MASDRPLTELRNISDANMDLLAEGERLLRASENVADPQAKKQMVDAAKRLLDIAARIRGAVKVSASAM